MYMIGWEGSYSEEREFQGHTYSQNVTEVVIATQEALVHYKLCQNARSGKTTIFTDLDTSFKLKGGDNGHSGEMEDVKRHQQWSRMNRGVARKGSRISYMPFSDTDALQAERPVLAHAIMSQEKAVNAWLVVTGQDDTPRYDDLLSTAEKITADHREVRLHEKAIAMADVDPMWGMF